MELSYGKVKLGLWFRLQIENKRKSFDYHQGWHQDYLLFVTPTEVGLILKYAASIMLPEFAME